MGGKGPAQKALIEKHGIGCAEVGKMLQADRAFFGISLIEPMENVFRNLGCTFGKKLTCRDHKGMNALIRNVAVRLHRRFGGCPDFPVNRARGSLAVSWSRKIGQVGKVYSTG